MSCPLCKNPSNSTFDPFCSKSCKNTDLLRWFNEDYRIPTEEILDDEEVDEENES
jgi:endogenous inhibitor of DNA gyrase (YacG/DUF329 family)